jgi:hypothetical protein
VATGVLEAIAFLLDLNTISDVRRHCSELLIVVSMMFISFSFLFCKNFFFLKTSLKVLSVAYFLKSNILELVL